MISSFVSNRKSMNPTLIKQTNDSALKGRNYSVMENIKSSQHKSEDVLPSYISKDNVYENRG